MSNPTSNFILPSDEQYDGSNWIAFKTKIRAVAKARGTLGYLDGTIPRPGTIIIPPRPSSSKSAASSESDNSDYSTAASTVTGLAPRAPTTYWGSTIPTLDEWDQRDAWTQGLVTLNVKNPVGLGINMTGTAAETWKSLTSVKDAVSDLGCITAELALSAIRYTDGQDMEEHVAKLRMAWAKANDQGAAINDAKFRMIVLRSMPASWLTFIGSLYAETSSAQVIARLVAHASLAATYAKPASVAHAQALSTQSGGRGRQLRNPHEVCTNCKKPGHLVERCFRPGGGIGQFPEWWGKKGGGGSSSSSSIAAVALASPSQAPAAPTPTPTTHASLATTGEYLALSTISEPSAIAMSTATSPMILTYADSAASEHFFARRSDFDDADYVPMTRAPGSTATGAGFDIVGSGTVRKRTLIDGKFINLRFENALHVPKFTHNLISIGCLDRRGCRIEFGGGTAVFRSPGGDIFMRGVSAGTMYRVDLFDPTVLPQALSARSLVRPTTIFGWHRRAGHLAESAIRGMITDKLVDGLDVTSWTTHGRCEPCIFGKQHRRSFDCVVTAESELLERVHMDLWGPASVTSAGGKNYMMVFVDGHGGHVEVSFLSTKDAETTLICFKHYHVRAERQTGRKLRRARTDGGSEFVNALWAAYFAEFGIVHEVVAPYSSSANGVAERSFRTILNGTRTVLIDAKLAGKWWCEAAAYVVYTLDFIPMKRRPGVIPRQEWLGDDRRVNVAHLRPFGCIAYAKIPDAISAGKLAPRSVKCVMVGYFGVGTYRLLHLETGRIFKSRDVVFEEGLGRRTLDPPAVEEEVDTSFFDDSALPAAEGALADDLDGALGLPAPHDTLPNPKPNDPDTTTGPLATDTNAPADPVAQAEVVAGQEPRLAAPSVPDARRSSRLAGGPAPAIPRLDETLACAVAGPVEDDLSLPRNVAEALARPDRWKAPMDKEFAMMLEKNVWRLVKRPPGAKTMKCRWVWANKLDGEGKLVSRKARLVAKGFTQIHGVHFWESFASVVRYESLRMALAIGTARDMEIWQADYASAYLNAPNQVPILMEQPEGYEVYSLDGCVPSPDTVRIPDPDGYIYELQAFVPAGGDVVSCMDKYLSSPPAPPAPPITDDDLVLVLDKALYGTIDGAYNWEKALNQSMVDLGYYRSEADQSVRARLVKDEHTITCTYSDDVTGFSTSTSGKEVAVQELGQKYEIKDLGDAKYVIGLTLERDRKNGMLCIHLRPYLERIIDRFGMRDSAPKYTPLPAGVVLNKTQCPSTEADRTFMKDKPYREALGCAQFAQGCARLDIGLALAILSQFASNPGPAHWKALMHLFAYLNTTLHFKLRYGGRGNKSIAPHGYVDADYAGNTDHRRSCTGYVMFMNDGPVAWKSQYQKTVAGSTSAAEYNAMAAAATQLNWMFESISEMGLPQQRPAVLRGDNQSALSIASNRKNNATVKHVEVKDHYIRREVAKGNISVTYVPSEENIADIFTKPLGRTAHWKICAALRLCEPDDPLIRHGDDSLP